MNLSRYPILPLLLGFAAGPACLVGEGTCDQPTPIDIDPAGVHYRYVVDSIQMPSTPSEANEYGLDLDGDLNGRPDNAFGQVLATILTNTDEEDALNDEIAARILDAELVELFDLQATDLGLAEGAGFWAFVGTDADADLTNNLDGNGQFRVRLSGDPMSGNIVDGKVSASLGTVPLQFALPGVAEPLVLTLRSAQVLATIDGNRMTGKIGGGISEQDVDLVLIPAIQFVVEHEIAKYCDDSGCEPDSTGAWLSEQYDLDHDGEISFEEAHSNSLTNALLAPDLDLLDQGIPSPRCDGEKESLSIGVGFTAVSASFPVPGEAG